VPETIAHPQTRVLQPEADLLFSTARVRMTDGHAERIRAAVRKQVDWIRLIQLSLRHETTALLYRHLQRICPDTVPPGILEPLAARCKMQSAEAWHRAEKLVRILGALEKDGIFAVPYKGPVLSQRLYGDLSLREFSERSDLDIMIRPRDLRRARDVILSQGYRLAFPGKVTEIGEYARTNRELHFLQPDGPRMLELHWRFMIRSARVQQDPERFLQRVEMIPFAGAMVRSLPLEVYIQVLSMHATKHKWGKLKLVCDIAEILQSPDVDWDCVLREAADLGLRRILAIGVLLAEDPLGVVAPARLTNGLKIDQSTRDLAKECRQALLEEPHPHWREDADYKFLLRIRERLRDRATIYLKNRLLPRITPDERDRQLVPIPGPLSALYYFVRPMRMVWEKITERP
jgi:hypothetical protein